MNLPGFRKPPSGASEGHQPDSRPEPAKPTTRQMAPTREFCFGRRLAFTVDDDALQMAAASHLGTRVKLLDATKFYFPTESNATVDRSHLLQSTIRDYIDRYGGRRPSITLTLTGPQTALRSVVLPHLKGAELEAALNYEGRRQVPFPAEDCWIDHRVTETITLNQERRLRATVLAATKLAIQELVAPFQNLSLTVGHIYHTQDVIGQLLETLPAYREDRPYTLIDVHRRSTEIAYYRGRNLEFYHVSSLGSSFLANRSDPTVFEYFAESLVTEIQNSLDYYGGQFATRQEPEIFVYGDLAYTEELISLLSDRYGLRFRRFPSGDLGLRTSRELSTDNICVNLPAVAAAVSRVRIANLLPTPDKQRIKLQKTNWVGAAALMLLGCLFMAQWLVSVTSLASAKARLAQQERLASEFRASEMFATYNRLKRKLAANRMFFDQAHDDPSYLGLNLKELSHLVPSPVRLYDLEFKADATDRNYLLSGLITAKSTPPALVLAEMVENMVASDFFEDITVERHVKRRQPEGTVLDFTLSMRGII